LVVTDAMAEREAYNLARALVENVDRLRSVHQSMRALTPEFMASQTVIPYHPGALRFYRETGLIE
jgi:TRAP-type uncharacterized transport system substrate-binding protein